MFRELRDAFNGQGQLSYRNGVVLVAASGVLFSFTALFFRASENTTDWQFLLYRGFGSFLMLSLVAYLRRKNRPVDWSSLNTNVALASVLLMAMQMLFIVALARSTVASINFLFAVTPFFGALFGWLFLRERIDLRTALTMGLALFGVAVMVSSELEVGPSTGLVFAGIIPVLLGLYSVLLRTEPDADPLVPAIIASALITVGSAGVCLLTDGLFPGGRDVALGLAAGGLLLGLGLPLFNLGHRAVPAAQVSLLLLTEIVLGPVWVWIWPGETPTTGTLIGGAIILAAVVVLVLGRSDEDLSTT